MRDAADFEGINIMIRRKGLGLSQAELADMLDTTRRSPSPDGKTAHASPRDPHGQSTSCSTSAKSGS